jgi:signal transduction histidine kinase
MGKESELDVESRFNMPINLWPVDGDKIQIHRLIGSITRNALDAMGTGGEIEIVRRRFGFPGAA